MEISKEWVIMSEASLEMMGCDCCVVVCPAPSVTYASARIEVRIAGYGDDDVLYRKQSWSFVYESSYNARVNLQEGGSPGDTSRLINSGDFTANDITLQSVTGHLNLGTSITAMHSINEQVDAVRENEQSKHRINFEDWNMDIDLIQPEVTIASVVDESSLDGQLIYEVETHGEPTSSATTEAVDVNTEMTITVTQDAYSPAGSPLSVTRIDRDVTFAVSGFNTFSNGLSITALNTLVNGTVSKARIFFDTSGDDGPSYDDEVTDQDFIDKLSAISPLEENFTRTSLPSLSISNEFYQDDDGLGDYHYKLAVEEVSRVKFQIPSSYKGSFFEIEYEVWVGGELNSESSLVWSGPGDETNSESESWFVESELLPRATSEDDDIIVIPIRYRCYTGGFWTDF